jgi:hypothetical protein
MAKEYSKQEAGYQQCFGTVKMAEPWALDRMRRIYSPLYLHCYTKTEILNFAILEKLLTAIYFEVVYVRS